jgi:hypothetical protein
VEEPPRSREVIRPRKHSDQNERRWNNRSLGFACPLKRPSSLRNSRALCPRSRSCQDLLLHNWARRCLRL